MRTYICNTTFVKSTNKTVCFKKSAQCFPFYEFQIAQAVSKIVLLQMTENSQNCQNLRACEGSFTVDMTWPVSCFLEPGASLPLARTRAVTRTAKAAPTVPESVL